MEKEELLCEAQWWQSHDFNPETRAAVEAMISHGDEEALAAAFGSRISFGTAGLRAEMGPGLSRMNDLVVIQAAQGVMTYLQASMGLPEVQNRGIVIGWDHRRRGSMSSYRFAVLSAAVFCSRGVKTFLFSELCPTPFVPFAVQEHGAAAGIMVTASHNPKLDDGYKLYASNGCQIVSPVDSNIQKAILENLEPWADDYNEQTEELLREKYKAICLDMIADIADKYFEKLAKKLCRHPDDNLNNTSLRFTYTAMHGVGHRWAERSFEAFRHGPFIPVSSQVQPDPDFPTVPFPNPEEKGALDIAIQTADKNGSTVVLANDPDADRFAVAEKGRDGQWRVFTGNEIAALLGLWEWKNYHKSEGSKGAAMVASTVSSKFLGAVGKAEGFRFEETLTGFKWMGNRSLELRQEGYDVLFSFEEAIGFCCGELVADKDGISTISVFAEMAVQLAKEGKNCAEHLLELQQKYGFFLTNNSYVLSRDTKANERVFRSLGSNGKYVESCGKYKVNQVRDLQAPGYDSSQPDKIPCLPVSSSSSMLTFTFENGCVATLRMSGTEPKLKYYCELNGNDPNVVREELNDLVENGIKGEWLKELIKK